MNTTGLWLYRFLARFLPPTRFFGFKAGFLRLCGARIGSNVRIVSDVVIMGDGRLEIGNDVWIGSGSLILSSGEGLIAIGSNVDIAPQVTLATGSHEVDSKGPHMAGNGFNGTIKIGDGVWLGVRSTVLPDVTIPSYAVVAAGSVVAKTVVGDGRILIAGVPATIKKYYA